MSAPSGAARPQAARRWARRLLVLAGALILAAGAGAVWLRPALCFLGRASDAGLRFCPEHPPRWSPLEVPEAGLTVHVYQPARPATATIVLVPGLHPDGVSDPRFRSFAAACAEAGFQVVAPDVVEFRTFHIEGEVVDRLARLVLALPQHLAGTSLHNVGLFGVSYAGGPVLVAAARPEVAARLHFVGAFGGYYDLAHAVEYALTGAHPRSCPGPLPAPHQWARMILVAQDPGAFLPAVEAERLGQDLRLRLALKVGEAQALEAAMDPPARAFLQAVLDGPSPERAEQFRAALPRFAQLSQRLSPRGVVPAIDHGLRIYLLHGRGDDVIPYCETEELEQALRQSRHPHVHALISRAFRHMDPRAGEGSALARAGERVRLLVWTRRFLDEARR